MCGGTCSWRFRYRQRWLSVAKQFPDICWLRATSWESLFEFTTENWLSIRRRHERPRYELVDTRNVYVCHAGCSRSSWKGLFGEFTFCQKSATTNNKTIIRCDKKVDHRSNRNSRYIEAWLAHASLAKDHSVSWQSSPLIKQQESVYSPIPCCVWARRIYTQSPQTHGKRRLSGLWVPLNIESWTKSVGSRWNSSEKLPRIHYITDSRRDPEKWSTKCSVSNSQDGSSSCQCTMTLYGEKKETKNFVLRMPEPWQDMQKDSHKDIGRFSGLAPKRNGTDQTRTSRVENGMMSLNTCCSTLAKGDISYSVEPVFGTRSFEKQSGWKIVCTLLWWSTKCWSGFFALLFPSISSVFTEQ